MKPFFIIISPKPCTREVALRGLVAGKFNLPVISARSITSRLREKFFSPSDCVKRRLCAVGTEAGQLEIIGEPDQQFRTTFRKFAMCGILEYKIVCHYKLKPKIQFLNSNVSPHSANLLLGAVLFRPAPMSTSEVRFVNAQLSAVNVDFFCLPMTKQKIKTKGEPICNP